MSSLAPHRYPSLLQGIVLSSIYRACSSDRILAIYRGTFLRHWYRGRVPNPNVNCVPRANVLEEGCTPVYPQRWDPTRQTAQEQVSWQQDPTMSLAGEGTTDLVGQITYTGFKQVILDAPFCKIGIETRACDRFVVADSTRVLSCQRSNIGRFQESLIRESKLTWGKARRGTQWRNHRHTIQPLF